MRTVYQPGCADSSWCATAVALARWPPPVSAIRKSSRRAAGRSSTQADRGCVHTAPGKGGQGERGAAIGILDVRLIRTLCSGGEKCEAAERGREHHGRQGFRLRRVG